MAAQTAQVILVMCRARKIRMILPRGMTFQTTLVYRFRGCSFEAEDLRCVPTALDVVLARTMTSFATLFGCSTTIIQKRFPMRGHFEILVNVVVTDFALFRANVFRRGHRLAWHSFLVRCILWASGRVGRRCLLA